MSTKKIQIVGSLYEVDSTLAQSGQAADAKATGDAINLVQADINRVSDMIGESSVSEQIEAAIVNKAEVGHNHDSRYYTEAEIDEMLSVIPTTLADLDDDEIHRTVTDEEKSIWNAKSDFSGDYNDLSNKPTIPSIAGLATESYVDEAVAVKADIGHTHDERYYTESEIDEKIYEVNNSIIEAKSYADSNDATTLAAAQIYADNAVAQKSAVQIITWGADD